MKGEKTSKRKKLIYYVILAISVCLLVAATVLTVYFVSDAKNDNVIDKDPSTPVVPDDSNDPDDSKDPTPPDVPSTGDDVVKFTVPLVSETVSVYDVIYKSATTNFIYRHKAVDFAAAAGTAVAAVADGTVESISLNESTGNIVTVDHGNGLKSLYRFVEPVSTLKKGDSVKKGDKIAEVATAYGSEAKDGEHLHLEMEENGKKVDPAKYLDIEYDEK